ncbi:MAG: Gx transporter family protein, partial [Oscillospiraceae bacterium]|nr:Gx transporter family protein [Oscillospiraceae bacterium]
MPSSDKTPARGTTARLTRLALLLACALVLGLLERTLPPVALPGVRLGLSNAAVLTALYLFPFPEALLLALLKCVLLAALGGSFPAFLYSLSGAVFSLFVMWPLTRLGKVSPVGVSVTGAVCHNVAQLLCASALMQTLLLSYLP